MFCSYCGRENFDDGKYCTSCGKPLVREIVASENSATLNIHTLTIFRESQMYLINPPINIRINGNMTQSIANGETLKLSMDEGIYTVEFSQSMRKRIIKIDLTKDVQITVKWNRITGSINADIS